MEVCTLREKGGGRRRGERDRNWESSKVQRKFSVCYLWVINTKTSVNRKKEPLERGIILEIVGSESRREGNEGTQRVSRQAAGVLLPPEERPRAERVPDRSPTALQLVLTPPLAHSASLPSEPLFPQE